MIPLALTAGLSIALVARGRDPERRGRRVDVSLQEATSMATLQHASASAYRWTHQVPKRRGLSALRARHLYPCSDGRWVSFVVPPYRWREFLEWCADEDLAGHFDDPQWSDPAYRVGESHRLAAVIEELCSRYEQSYLFHEGQRRRLLVMPSNTPAELIYDRQLRARGFFTDVLLDDERRLVDTGTAWYFSVTPSAVPRRAPHLGEHNPDVYEGLLDLSRDEMDELTRKGVI